MHIWLKFIMIIRLCTYMIIMIIKLCMLYMLICYVVYKPDLFVGNNQWHLHLHELITYLHYPNRNSQEIASEWWCLFLWDHVDMLLKIGQILKSQKTGLTRSSGQFVVLFPKLKRFIMILQCIHPWLTLEIVGLWWQVINSRFSLHKFSSPYFWRGK